MIDRSVRLASSGSEGGVPPWGISHSPGKQGVGGEELARQDVEPWSAHENNVNVGSWTTSSSGTPKHGDKAGLENWGRNHPAGSEGEALPAAGADTSPTAESRECVDNRSPAAAAAAARARGAASGVSQAELAGRRGGFSGSGGTAGAGAGAGGGSGMSSGGSSGAPCGACKFLRRKCVRGCIFAPYFGAEQGAAKFAAVHKVFGASNVAKLLLHIPTPRRCDAVLTISYEAQARLSDPVYGCVATIFALQQQVASLQAELAMVQAQLADRHAHLQQTHNHQQQQRMVFAPSQAEYMQQHLADHSQMSPTSGLSMGMPGGSSYSSRVKPEEGSYHLGHGMAQHQQHQHQQHHYDLGMPSSSLHDPSEHSLLESLQKSRGDPQDEGELQALASLFRRK